MKTIQSSAENSLDALRLVVLKRLLEIYLASEEIAAADLTP